MSLVEKIGLAGVAAEDVLHARGQRHRIAAGVALHALGLAGGAAGVERVARVRGIDPDAGHDGVQVLLAQRRVVGVAAGHALERREAAIDHQHLRRLVRARRIASSSRPLYGTTLPLRLPASALTITVGSASSMRLARLAAGEAAEHHRMDRADARAGEHRERRLGDHRHVDQHPVALLDAERQQHRRHALHFGVQFAEAVDALLVGLGRDEDQRVLVGTRRRGGGRSALWHRLVWPPTNQRANGGLL